MIHTDTSWNIFQKIGFRFFFVYVLLYVFPFPLDSLQYIQVNIVTNLPEIIWGNIVPFFGDLFFDIKLEGRPTPTGSGDMMYDYIHLFACVFIAAFGAIIWSLIDRKRKTIQNSSDYW